MNIKTIFIAVISSSLIIAYSCNRNARIPEPIIPQEQITSVILTFADEKWPFITQYFLWEDLDGFGGKSPIIDTIRLDSGTIYNVSALLIDKSKSVYDTISYEIKSKAEIHQFFYELGGNLKDKVIIIRKDKDQNKLPLGLEFSINTYGFQGMSMQVFSGLNMVLSHYDGIPKTDARSPESDLDITFPLTIK